MAHEKITASRPTPAPPAAGNGRPGQPASSPSGKAKMKAKDEHRDVVREIWETVVFVVVLVLMLKTFVAEAFVIPTGSMAETLYGYQRQVTCKQCKHVFPVNCSSEFDPPDGPDGDRRLRAVTGCTCPNCQYEIQWEKGEGPEWYTGDRVLVAKFLFDRDYLWRPHRHDVFVFKFPKEPQKGTTAMNYIKRCEGEPEETIVIFGGDLYVTKSLKHALPAGDPKNFWQPENMHTNDPAAIELFTDSLKRRVAGQTSAGDFQIIRKPPAQILAMRRLVYNNDFQPIDLAGKPQFRRWRPTEKDRWSDDDANAPKVFSHAGAVTDGGEDWLVYNHRLRDSAMRNLPKNPDGYETDPRRLISNMMGYNSGDGDHNRDGDSWVGDLMIDCTVKVTKPEGELVFDLAKGIDRFQARFDLASGNCKLVRLTGTWKDGREQQVLGEKPTKLKGTGKWQVRFADVDERLTVWVDRSLPFGDGVAYGPPQKRGPVGENDLEPARIGVVKGGIDISHLQLWRDSYYTLNGQKASVPIRVDAFEESTQSFYVQPGHYLALGDNSSASADSRYWGVVPERLLLGRALMVYFPFWPFAAETRFGPIR